MGLSWTARLHVAVTSNWWSWNYGVLAGLRLVAPSRPLPLEEMASDGRTLSCPRHICGCMYVFLITYSIAVSTRTVVQRGCGIGFKLQQIVPLRLHDQLLPLAEVPISL